MRTLTQRLALVTACGLTLAAAAPLWAQSALNLATFNDSRSSPDIKPYLGNQPYIPTIRTPTQFNHSGSLSARPTAVAPLFQQPQARPLPSNVQNVIGYFGSQHAANTLNKMPQRPVMTTRTTAAIRPQQQRPQNKPFNAASNGTTVSPYLNLYRQEDIDSAPNYFAFVRPQVQQQEENQKQQAELQRLNRQVQRVSVSYGTSAAGAGTGVVPATGHSARFGDTAQFYGGFTR